MRRFYQVLIAICVALIPIGICLKKWIIIFIPGTILFILFCIKAAEEKDIITESMVFGSYDIFDTILLIMEKIGILK